MASMLTVATLASARSAASVPPAKSIWDKVQPPMMHAALVERKSKGAADYWMVGEATMPMGMFGFPP